ncbi:MAG: MarR family transcriptional regulator [Acidobacteria bacterium]|nr:MarR family transcriptional regulator [Acidobacteriota bacterium]
MGRLQRELRQNRPFQSTAHEAVVGLIRTADMVRRQMTALVGPQGITLQQFNVLRILRGAGSEARDGVPTLEIADRMIEQTPGVTRLLDRLEAKELVRRQRCPKDRRQHLCWITPKGLALLQKLDEAALRSHEESMKGLRAKDRATFIRLMEAIRAPHQ